MSKTSVLQRLIPDAKLKRNAFDRSCVINNSQLGGQLHVVFCEAFPQGSHVQLNRQVFTRSSAVNTAAFATIDQHTEFFAVPISYLWSYWDNFKLKINDYNSTALPIYSSGGFVGYNPSSVPYFDVNAFLGQDIYSWGTQYRQDQMGFNYAEGALRLMEEMAAPTDVYDQNSPCVSNLLKFAAYQKVYSDHFRNSMYEANNPYAYNLDWITVDSANNNNAIDFSDSNHRARFFELTMMRYKDWRKDYYKNLYPSLNYSSNMDSQSSFTLPSSILGLGDGNYQSVVLSSFNNSPGLDPAIVQYSNAGPRTNISAQSIRTLFALDKLMRHIAYAPKHVKQQLEARFGVNASLKQSFESVRIGQFMNDIVIGEVTSMANTENSGTGDKLGAIGGKGIGSAQFGHDLDYNCDMDCIIIGINYFIPRTSYDAKGIDNWNMKLVPEDFFIPEYMDLGLQPLYRKEINRVGTSGDNNVLGYLPRYQEYKLGRDKNYGAFKSFFGKFSRGSGGTSITFSSGHAGALQDFVIHTNNDINWSLLTAADLTYFKVNPKCLDSIFVQASDYNMNPNDDQFYYNMIIKCLSNQNMSVHGQPSF